MEGKKDVMLNPENYDFEVATLGPSRIQTPVTGQAFVEDEDRILLSDNLQDVLRLHEAGRPVPQAEKAGPRSQLYHDPAWSRAAIVTCGGLCPGLNDVIKGLVQVLHFEYGVKSIYGIPYGYRGLNPEYRLSPIMLNPDAVDTIHEVGGTILGSSRGEQPVDVIVDTLQRLGINLLFAVGGDGTLRGAHAIAEEIKRRKQPISVIGIPKTIDNDLSFTDRTFGFETAVYATHDIITSAHVEARGAHQGVAIVKLMGRDSGFIAAHASLSNSVVNFCLIPELEFDLEGPHGLLQALERRFSVGKTHAVIVVAEGAGQHLFEQKNGKTDPSGNQLKEDIGILLKERIKQSFQADGKGISVKYFDPSYQIRSIPAHGNDSIFCMQLSQYAVHAAMAGKTDVVIGSWGTEFIHVPIQLATQERKKVDTEGSLWKAVLGATRQEDWFALSRRR